MKLEYDVRRGPGEVTVRWNLNVGEADIQADPGAAAIWTLASALASPSGVAQPRRFVAEGERLIAGLRPQGATAWVLQTYAAREFWRVAAGVDPRYVRHQQLVDELLLGAKTAVSRELEASLRRQLAGSATSSDEALPTRSHGNTAR